MIRKYILGLNVLAIAVLVIFAAYSSTQSHAPKNAQASTTTPTDTPPTTTAISPSSTPDNTSPTATPTKATSQYKDGTFSAASPTDWGPLQLRVTFQSGGISDITTEQTPDSGPSQYAVPILVQEQLASKTSTNIDTITGATSTSVAFEQVMNTIFNNAKN